MTTEEAIVVLQKIKPIPHRGDSKSTTHILETIALDMAIKALEEVSMLSENLHREREQAYMSGYEEGRKSLLDGLSSADW